MHMEQRRYSYIILDIGTSLRVLTFTLRLLCLSEISPGTHWTCCCLGRRVCLDAVKYREISFPCRESNLRPLAHNPWLHRSCYLASQRPNSVCFILCPLYLGGDFVCNLILFAICTSTFSISCKTCIHLHSGM
jgi:hypothetical protein